MAKVTTHKIRGDDRPITVRGNVAYWEGDQVARWDERGTLHINPHYRSDSRLVQALMDIRGRS